MIANGRGGAGRMGRRPVGAVVCTAVLAGAYQCGPTFSAPPRTIVTIIGGVARSRGRISIVLDEFGDYSPGRWAWLLTDVEPFDPPIPARGAQGFWDWHEDAAGDRR